MLAPRGLDHKLQFTGPTGANAVEAALKVARQATGRSTVVAFTNAFHGLSLGSLAATGNSHYRGAAGVGLDDVARLPYDGYLGAEVDTLDLLEKMLDDPGAGLDLPAAVIVEAVQGEGGINVASAGVAAAPARDHGGPRHPADPRRDPGRRRTHRRVLRVRGVGHRARHRHRLEVDLGLGPAHVARAAAPRGRRLEARPAHRNVPRQQPRVRLRARRARDLLGRRRVHRRDRGEVGAAARRARAHRRRRTPTRASWCAAAA